MYFYDTIKGNNITPSSDDIIYYVPVQTGSGEYTVKKYKERKITADYLNYLLEHEDEIKLTESDYLFETLKLIIMSANISHQSKISAIGEIESIQEDLFLAAAGAYNNEEINKRVTRRTFDFSKNDFVEYMKRNNR